MSRDAQAYSDHLHSVRERLSRAQLNDPALAVCISGLARVEEILRKPLRVVILGEYNSGKTSVTDLLIGEGLLPTSVVSNTRIPVLITYAPTAALYGIDRNETRIRVDSTGDDALTDLSYRALHVALPLECLRNYQILDTPSSVSPATLVADADIVIWCTVATRAWTESERIAWSKLPKRCMRNALLVATHKDSLQTPEDCEHVARRLRQQTAGQFRSVVLVGARVHEGGASGASETEAAASAASLREAIATIANGILDRKVSKAEKIVRRLSRLTFHEFAHRAVRQDAVALLASWEIHARNLVDDLGEGRKAMAETIENLLTSYALFAEKLRPGVVAADGGLPVSGHTMMAAPARWPVQNAAAARLAEGLASDLTGLLRMLAGTSSLMHPDARVEIQTVQSLLLSLSDLDGAFSGLTTMLRAPENARLA